MKKSTFVSLLLGVIGGMFFSFGMCMALLPEWNMFQEGIVVGCIGLLILLIMIFVWRKMEHKKPLHLSFKTICAILIGVIGSLLFGVGMSMAMVWNQIIYGTLIGMLGILVLICLFSYVKGLK